MSDVPYYMIKRMFPRDTCLQMVKYKDEDFIQILFVNVVAPVEIPAPPYNFGNLQSPQDVCKILKISVNRINIPVTPALILNDFIIWLAGKEHTWKSVMADGSAANVVIPVGSKVAALFRKKSFPKEVQDTIFDGTETEIKVQLSLEYPVTITISAVLHITGNFDPSKI